MKLQDAHSSGGEALVRSRALFLVGALLSFSAGTVNGVATATLVLERTMHMSGRVNDLLRDLIFDLPEGLLLTCLIGSFLIGAFITGRLVPRRGVTFALLCVAGLLAVATLAALAEEIFYLNRYLVAALLALAGGVQNSATSQSKVGRTTHITGDLTDMAIAFSVGNRNSANFLLTKLAAFSTGGLAGFMGVHYGNLTLVLAACALIVFVVARFRPPE